MADMKRESAEEYWRPAPNAASAFPTQLRAREEEAFCAFCGTPYAIAARYCHFCGLSRESAQEKRNPIKHWLDVAAIQSRFGLPMLSLILMLAALLFAVATVMVGLLYDTATLAEWQAVQTWRIEWLLATLVALLAAVLFKTKP
jgi:hypothetical protein